MKKILAAALLCLPLLAQAPAAKPAAKPAAPPAAKVAPAAAPAPAATGFVGNKDSKICHKADCKSVAKMKAANKVSFASAADAQAKGFKACKTCKPF